jgi:uncharacterized protein
MTRATASRPFQVFVKPIGAVCNIECRYCYYLDKRHLYPDSRTFRMSGELLEKYIVQHIAACPTPTVLFSWHGGEPTVLGIDYFRRVLELQRRHRPAGREIVNGIQTNGTLLDDDWCRFLADEGFYVGLSLDGPRELHDAYRLAKQQRPTHELVMAAFQKLQSREVHCDILCVLNERNVRHPAQVYGFFKSIGVRHLVFLPLVMQAPGGTVTPESVPAEAFGNFLCTVFDEWVRHDIRRIYVQMFEEATRPARGMEHSLCTLRKTCGELPVLEHNGDFYSCDHFVDRDHFLGNIRETSLLEVLEGAPQARFGQMKWDTVPRRCRTCNVLEYCNGGCPKDRFVTNRDGEAGANYLCPGLHRFFTHAKPYVKRLASYLQASRPVEEFMASVRADDAKAGPAIGRNDDCPCGSGRKYKKCCLGKRGPATGAAFCRSRS